MKRIGRIAKGETIVANMITEDLQCLWDKVAECRDDSIRAYEAWDEAPKDKEVARLAVTKKHEFDMLLGDFWMKINERYDCWLFNVGVRDNYALVRIPGGSPHKMFGSHSGHGSLKDFIRFLKEMTGEDPGEGKSKGFETY